MDPFEGGGRCNNEIIRAFVVRVLVTAGLQLGNYMNGK